MSTDIRVALVYQQESGTATLRTALANAGVEIRVECKADALPGSAILSQDVDAVVVNLDPELEDLLDEVTDALDGATQPVIYNDPAASSDLSGWDRARWLRHLSAKLKGRSDVTPPAPVGSESIPTPTKRFAAIVAPAAVAMPVTAAAAAPIVEAPVSEVESFSLDFADQDAFANGSAASQDAISQSSASPEARNFEAQSSDGGNFADIDSFFDDIPSFDAAPPGSTAVPAVAGDDFSFDSLNLPDTVELAVPDTLKSKAAADSPVVADEEFSLDALFAESADFETPVADTPAAEKTASQEFFIDGLFDTEDSASPSLATSAAPAADDGLADLDALFREFEASQTAEVKTPEIAAVVSAPKKTMEAKSAPSDWSLEPFAVEEIAKPAITTVSEWRLENPAKATGEPVLPVVLDPGPKSPSAQLPADLEASLALADLKLLDDDFMLDVAPVQPSASSAATRADDGFMDLGGSLSLLDDSPGSSAASASENELGLADLDFALDLGDLEDSQIGQNGAGEVDFGAGLDDLDSLFEPVTAPPVMGLALPDLNRVFVLGASIGGPESIKAFLSKLQPNVPAAFIIAQHMGAEFLEMMAVQLNAASSLSVRCPKSGERLRHGEVLVAPVGEQLVIDESGTVRLSAANSNSPYSPSIDQLIHDAADRFGDHATLILFSGMGTDSIEGGRYLKGRGGQVWAQDRASCVIASMIDAAKAQGLVSFEGNPAQLAERVSSLN